MKRNNNRGYFVIALVVFVVLGSILVILFVDRNRLSVRTPETLVGQIANSSSVQVWFAPNIASADFIHLFTNPSLWATALTRLSVFQFYQEQLQSLAPCGLCGPNSGQALVDANAFPAIAAVGKYAAIEVQPLKHYICAANRVTPWEYSSNISKQILQNVGAIGGSIRYLSMDEPLIGGWQTIAGQSCGYTIAQSAHAVAQYINAVKAQYPAIQIGDIEAYPDPSLQPTPADPNKAQGSVQRIKDFIFALEGQGINLPFFHLDVNREAATQWNTNIIQDIRELQTFFASRPYHPHFGIIINANDLPGYLAHNDAEFAASARSWIGELTSILQNPLDDIIIQSWHEYPLGVKSIPRNLPETGANTHTRILLDALAALSPTTQPPPTFNFGIGLSGNATVQQGSSGQITVSATLTQGAAQSITFTASGLPTGITATFNPLSCAPPCSSTLSLTASPSAPPVSGASIAITGTAGALTRSTSFTLAVTATTPSSPTSLTGTSISSTQINLSWIDNAANENGFRIERRITNGIFALIGNSNANSTTYLDSSLATGTQYIYRVYAFNSGGQSVPSSEFTITTTSIPPLISIPSAPSGLTAVRAGSFINLAWQDNASNETSFTIKRQSGSSPAFGVITTGISPNITTYTDQTIVWGIVYSYRVFALNATGESAPSNTAIGLVPLPTPPIPQPLPTPMPIPQPTPQPQPTPLPNPTPQPAPMPMPIIPQPAPLPAPDPVVIPEPIPAPNQNSRTILIWIVTSIAAMAITALIFFLL